MTLSSPVKRRYSPSFDDIDSENIDPSSLKSPSKKAKNVEGYPVKPAKVSHFVLKDTYSSTTSLSKPIITPKRLDTTCTSTHKPSASSSAPAAAGRSPKTKRIGILSRRRVSSSPFTRVDPPSFGLSNGMPFSIDAALSGTVSSYRPEPLQHVSVPTLEEAVPNGWMFDIHEDTPEDELNNIMEFSTQTLDISDDEGRRAAKDDRGKENIPPMDYPSLSVGPIEATRPISRKDMMTDEPRTPLGDLDAAEFYAEGCDASSFVIVPAEKSFTPNVDALEVSDISSPIQAKAKASEGSQDGWKDFLAQFEASTKAKAAAAASTPGDAAPEIEIWESESAKGDDDIVPQQTMVRPLEEVSSGADKSGVTGAVDEISSTALAL